MAQDIIIIPGSGSIIFNNTDGNQIGKFEPDGTDDIKFTNPRGRLKFADSVNATALDLSSVNETSASSIGASELKVDGNGTTSQYLRSDGDGTFTWATPPNTTYSVGNGGLSEYNFTSAYKTKLDGIESGANVTDSGNVTPILNSLSVLSGSITSAVITDVDAFSQSGTYASLRAQGTTKADVGLGNVTNESKATMFTNAALTGNPTAPTQTGTDDSTKIATTAFVQSRIDAIIGTAGSTLDTLGELSASLASDTSALSALTTTVGGKLQKDQNLSDLTNVSTARTNLGLGSLATLSTVGASEITDNSVGAAELNVTGNGTTSQYLRSDGDGTFTWATPPDTNTTYSAASTTNLGLIKLEDDTVQTTAANTVSTTASRTYGIQVNSSGQAVVNVPWSDTNTTYSVGDGGLTQYNFTSAYKTKLDGIATSANNYSLPTATTTTLGGVKLGSDTSQTTAANAVTTTASRTYAIQNNASGQMVVNVPWVDTNTNTTYSAGTGLTLSGTTFSVTANTYAPYSHTHSYLPLSGGTVTGDTNFTATLSADRISGVTLKNGDLRNNLGNPTVQEMALFHGQFNNKFRFISPTLQEESTDGTTWTTSTRASANQLGDMMIGEGQGTSFSAIPTGTVGTYGGYRLTWDVYAQTGYISLDYLYIYNSTNGNTVTFKIEAYHNTNGWANIASGTASNWPGHTVLKHSGIWYSQNTSQYSKVRITFESTRNNYTNAFTLYAIEWFGGYPQGRRNAEYYDKDKNVTFPAIITATGGNSTDWNSAYSQRLQWDGTSTNLVAATGRTSLGLGSLATLSTVGASEITDNSVGAAELNVTGNGTTSQYLRSDGDGTFTWATPPDTNTTYSAASTTNLGLIKLEDDTVQTTAANAVTTTASRTYGIQVNSSGQAVVNVPWVDTNTNTTYSAGTGLTLSGTTFSVTANTYAPYSHTHSYLPLLGGTLTGDLTLSYTYPRINLTDTNNDSDYAIINNDGNFGIYDATNSAYRLSILSNGNVGINTTTASNPLDVSGNVSIQGNLYFTGSATTTNQGRAIYFTGFDKEGTTDFSDAAYIKHTTNSGGLGGSVLEISAMNDATDGINFLVNSTASGVRINGYSILNTGNYTSTLDGRYYTETEVNNALALKSDLTSPTFTGTPTAPTAASNTNSTQIATTAYVQNELSELIGGANAAFDTLIEISASIASGDTTLQGLVDGKLSKSSNLSDLTDASAARTYLGLGSLATLSTVNASTITDNSVGAAELNVTGNGTTSQYLRSDGDGTFTWATPPNTTYSVGDGGLTQYNFTSAYKTKLDGIATGAQTNQNAFSNVAVSGQTTVAADNATDTLTFVAGNHITIYTDATNDTITIHGSDTNTTYSVGNGGLTEYNFTSAYKTKLDGIATSANNYSLPTATTTTLGGVKLGSDTSQTTAANAVTTTASRTYAIQNNASGQMVVNVPWVDTNTNTTYSAGTGLTLSGTTFSVTANTYAPYSHTHSYLPLSGGTISYFRVGTADTDFNSSINDSSGNGGLAVYNSSAYVPALYLQNNSGGDGLNVYGNSSLLGYTKIGTTTTSNGALLTIDYSNYTDMYAGDSANPLYIYTFYDNAVRFTNYHDGTALRLDGMLHVNSNSGIKINTSGNTYTWWNIQQNTGGPYLDFRFNGTSVGYIYYSGNVYQIDFTGQHRVVPSSGSLEGEIFQYVGLIVDADGTYQNVDSSTLPEINESLPNVSLCNTVKSKRVFGVISNQEDLDDNGNATYNFGAFNTSVNRGDETVGRIIINSVGEGGMWVCNSNGNIENGDYICSAGIMGLGMKQDDDLLHNYTVAKITMDCDFTDEDEAVEFEHEGITYKKQFVGVTYHCG